MSKSNTSIRGIVVVAVLLASVLIASASTVRSSGSAKKKQIFIDEQIFIGGDQQTVFPAFHSLKPMKYCGYDGEESDGEVYAIVQGKSFSKFEKHNTNSGKLLANATFDQPLWLPGWTNSSEPSSDSIGNTEQFNTAVHSVWNTTENGPVNLVSMFHSSHKDGSDSLGAYITLKVFYPQKKTYNELIFAQAWCPDFMWNCFNGPNYLGLNCDDSWESCCSVQANQGPSFCLPKDAGPDYTCCASSENSIVDVCTKGESCCPSAWNKESKKYVQCCPTELPTCCQADTGNACCGADSTCCNTNSNGVICCNSTQSCIQAPSSVSSCVNNHVLTEMEKSTGKTKREDLV